MTIKTINQFDTHKLDGINWFSYVNRHWYMHIYYNLSNRGWWNTVKWQFAMPTVDFSPFNVFDEWRDVHNIPLVFPLYFYRIPLPISNKIRGQSLPRNIFYLSLSKWSLGVIHDEICSTRFWSGNSTIEYYFPFLFTCQVIFHKFLSFESVDNSNSTEDKSVT